MTGNEYQALAMRTNDGKSTDRVISGVLTCDLKWLHNQNVVREDTEESTRYCNYGHEKEITVVEPYYFKDCQEDEPWKYDSWADACRTAEADYLVLIEDGASPQEARAVLPNSLKTEIVVTANLREWKNIFKLRAVGVTGKPHPQMLEVMVPLLEEVKKQIPVVFDDLVTE